MEYKATRNWSGYSNDVIQHKFENLFTEYLHTAICGAGYTVEVENEYEVGVYCKGELITKINFDNYGIPSDLVRRKINWIEKNLEAVKNDEENKQ